MNTKMIIIAAGAIILIVSLTADYIGLGNQEGMGFQQIVGSLVGLLVIVFALIRYKGKAVPGHVMRAVFALVVLYAGGYFVLGALLVLLETDVVTGFTAGLATLGNIGPGFSAVGAVENYGWFSVPTKLLLCLLMAMGRLEVMAIVVLFKPTFWRTE